MKSFVFAFLVVATIVMIAPVRAVYDPCNYIADCTSCTTNTSCGWCGGTIGVCMSRPGGNCNTLGGQFLTSTASCLANFPNCTARFPDTQNDSCTQCASDDRCGWCLTAGVGGTCRGSGFGSGFINACGTAGGTFYTTANVASCPTVASNAVRCRASLSCSECLADNRCGWCQSSSPDRSCFENSDPTASATFCTNSLYGFGPATYYTNVSQCPSFSACPLTSAPPRGVFMPANSQCQSFSSIGCCPQNVALAFNTLIPTLFPLSTSTQCRSALQSLVCGSMCSPSASTWTANNQVQLSQGLVDNVYCHCVAPVSAYASLYANSNAMLTVLSTNVTASYSLSFTVGASGYNPSVAACSTPAPSGNASTDASAVLLPTVALVVLIALLSLLL